MGPTENAEKQPTTAVDKKPNGKSHIKPLLATITIASIVGFFSMTRGESALNAENPQKHSVDWDTYSDTWGATDALGRTLPGNSLAGNPRPNKTLGMFCFMANDCAGSPVFDNTKLLAATSDKARLARSIGGENPGSVTTSAAILRSSASTFKCWPTPALT